MKRNTPFSLAILLGFVSFWNGPAHGQDADKPFACATNNGTITITKYVSNLRKIEVHDGIEPLLADLADEMVSIPAELHGRPVAEIGANAFANCPKITSVQIPEGVRRIGENAFRRCPGLQALQIPASVTSMHATAFADCSRLVAVRVDAANPAYWSDAGGVVFSKDKATLVRCPSGRPGDYKVPATVVAVGDFAFVGCRELKSVELPVGVTAVGQWAFADCTALADIQLPKTLAKIGEFAFWGCGGLNAIAIPDSVTDIGYFTFAHCSGLTSAFIPRSVTAMGPNIFRNCGRLTNIVVDAANPAFCSADGVVFDKQKTRLIAYPCGRAGAYAVLDGVTFIDQSSFRSAGLMTSVSLPRTVTGLGYKAFIGCSAAGGFFFEGDAPTQRRDVFAGCGRATVYRQAQAKRWSKDFGGRPTVVWDPKRPFVYTNSNGQVAITAYASPDETARLPDRIDGVPVTGIGPSAFQNCRHLTRVELPATLTRIGVGAFRDCVGLLGVAIPPGVATLERSAFQGCVSLSEIRLADGVRKIDAAAFAGCAKLTEVRLPASVTFVAASAFADCRGLAAIRANGDNPVFRSDKAGVLFSKDKTTLYRYPTGKAGEYSLPSCVTNIAPGAFETCTGLTSVAFSRCLVSLGSRAFARCPNLNRVTFSTSVTDIGAGAFQDCVGLPSVEFPDSLVSLGDGAFWNCPRLSRVELPARVARLGGNAFAYCDRLVAIEVDAANPVYASDGDGVVFSKDRATLTCYPAGRGGRYAIPGNVTQLGRTAFEGCRKVADVVMPDRVTRMGDYAFKGCAALTNVVLSAALAEVSVEAFGGCSGLSRVTVPASVGRVGDRAFQYCPKLAEVHFGGNAPGSGRTPFRASPNAVVYRSPEAQGWGKEFAERPTAIWNDPAPAVPAVSAKEQGKPVVTLQVGDPAPALAQGKYVQGEPVAAFEKGKVYVVEFWSTWCGPCRAAIPHVNALQAKHKNRGLVVIGQNVWQFGENVEKDVTAFVKQMGTNMTYCVALDRDGEMAETWMKAAGKKGIPCAFVVGKDGKVAWIGHPRSGLDEIVEKLLTGEFSTIQEPQTRPSSVRITGGGEKPMRPLPPGLTRLGTRQASASPPNPIRQPLSTENKALSVSSTPDQLSRALHPAIIPPTTAAQPFQPGLIAWWPGDGNVDDVVGHRKGVAVNGADFAPGLHGQAFRVNGRHQYFNIPHDPALSFTNGTPFTLEAWVFRMSKGLPFHVMGKRSVPERDSYWYQLGYDRRDPDVPTNQWVHLAVTYSDDRERRYMNGVMTDERSSRPEANRMLPQGSAPNRADIQIGCSGPYFGFAGLIDDIRIYNRALSQPEIAAHCRTDVMSSNAVNRTPSTLFKPLTIGDPAPALAQGKYVQGEPVAEFEKGKVYVVEFWATWCGPCRVAIPHVNALQAKYKDRGLVVIGQNVWQFGENVEKDVTAFVKQMGTNMTHRVALDRDGAMAKTWMDAAGRGGIPCAFVVDKDGKVAWIGHPLSGLEEAIEKLLADVPSARNTPQPRSQRITPAVDNHLPYEYTIYNGEVTITKYKGSSGDLIIPDMIEGKPVTVIRFGAFQKCEWLRSVTLSNHVKRVEHDAFAYCKALTTVVLPDSVEEIGNCAFGITGLKAVSIPAGVKKLDGNPFGFCRDLASVEVSTNSATFKSVDGVVFDKQMSRLVCFPSGRGGTYAIPQGVKDISFAFMGSGRLTHVTVPDSVTSIKSRAFDACSGLTSISIPDSVTTIDFQAFSCCFKLKSITLPVCLVNIGRNAFNQCNELTSIIIPEHVSKIDRTAFINCPNLTALYFCGKPPMLTDNSGVFYRGDRLTIYYRPDVEGWGPTFGGRPTRVWDSSAPVPPSTVQSAAQAPAALVASLSTAQSPVKRLQVGELSSRVEQTEEPDLTGAPEKFRSQIEKTKREIAEKGGFTVAGIVTDDENTFQTPGHVTIALKHDEFNAEDTDKFDNGWFVSRVLPADMVIYNKLVAASFTHDPVEWPLTILTNQLTWAKVTLAKTEPDKRTALSGAVRDEAGHHLAGANVTLTIYRSNGYFSSQARRQILSDAKGTYSFSGLTVQPYSLYAEKKGTIGLLLRLSSPVTVFLKLIGIRAKPSIPTSQRHCSCGSKGQKTFQVSQMATMPISCSLGPEPLLSTMSSKPTTPSRVNMS